MRHILLIVLLALPCAAECRVKFSAVYKDDLNNVQQGFGPKTLEWYEKKMTKKYPDVCYDPGPAPVVLFFSSRPAVYHGVKKYSTTTTQDNPVHGTVTDNSPGSSTYGQEVGEVNGTVESSTTTEHSVPYDVDYDRLYLSVEQEQSDGGWKVMHNFSGKTLHPTLYGICTRNCRPSYALIENAVKWLHDGGLTDAKQGVLP